MFAKNCLICHKQFFTTRRNRVSHCSTKCAYETRAVAISRARKGIKFSTEHLKHLSEAQKKRFKLHPKGKLSKEHCKKLSVTKLGNKNPQWKGGHRKWNGYIFSLERDHPCAVDGYILEHRLIAEKILKRFLSKKEIIHHINENRSDKSHIKFNIKFGLS